MCFGIGKLFNLRFTLFSLTTFENRLLTFTYYITGVNITILFCERFIVHNQQNHARP